jgi:hypothetical protein
MTVMVNSESKRTEQNRTRIMMASTCGRLSRQPTKRLEMIYDSSHGFCISSNRLRMAYLGCAVTAIPATVKADKHS